MITSFPDAFEYVNQRYIYNEENYPSLGRLTKLEGTIFALKHGFLHILEPLSKLGYQVERSKARISRLQYLAHPDEKLSSHTTEFKKATLKIIINILSMSHIVGRTDGEFLHEIPSDTKMEILEETTGGAISFQDHVQHFMKVLRPLLEKADHSSETDLIKIIATARKHVEDLCLATIYWFDDFWVPDFLTQIPNVMKSK